ncbi:unnamed protein product [Amoebophrya sp. A120]|nr:unnamed protein product [Amoebophrya sp. A120]|eukprot:GSA120T00023740001.1
MRLTSTVTISPDRRAKYQGEILLTVLEWFKLAASWCWGVIFFWTLSPALSATPFQNKNTRACSSQIATSSGIERGQKQYSLDMEMYCLRLYIVQQDDGHAMAR